MQVILVLDCFLLLAGIVMALYRLSVSKRTLRPSDYQAKEDGQKDYDNFSLLIPVYNEQAVIRQSFMNFLPMMEKGIEIVYVGTCKETEEVKTYDLLNSIIEEYEMQEHCKVMVYPFQNGVMAHQINYALQRMDDDRIVGLYNVDSKIDIRTVDYVLSNSDKLEDGVFQQYSYSLYGENALMRNAIMWQNRWSLDYELPRAASQSEFGIRKYNYVIGHGLLFKNSTMKEIGLFSEDQINEDNVMGYNLYCNEKKIYPIPYLEQIDFALNAHIYVKQQSVWFNGPLYSFAYFKNNQPTFDRLFMACQNFKNALNWWLFELLNVVLIVYYLIRLNPIVVALLLILISLYVTLPNILTEHLLFRNKYISDRERKTPVFFVRDIIFWLFIHSFGPIITFGKIVSGINDQKRKYKTEKQ